LKEKRKLKKIKMLKLMNKSKEVRIGKRLNMECMWNLLRTWKI
jgi:hypothetical protein